MSGIHFVAGAATVGGADAASPPALDATQRAVLALPDGVSAAVLGAPGTGKTTVAVELVADRILARGWDPAEVVVLTSSRVAATRLRDRLALRIGRPTDGPLARTVTSLAFEVVTASARAAGAEPPRLVTGGEQDADLAALLEGDIEDGGGPAWPEPLGPQVRRLRGFRSELRELAARATEFDIDPERMRALGRAASRPEWVAAADFLARMRGVAATARAEQLDAAELARFAVAAIGRGESAERVARLRLAIVDDLQEATEATLQILRALVGRGVAVIALGDPDIAGNAFRGGEPDALGRLASVLGIPDLATLVLGTAHRPVPAIRALTSATVAHIGTAAAGAQRRAVASVPAEEAAPDPERPALARIEGATPARVAAAIARLLREEHVLHGVPWGELAVVVRSSPQAPALARALALAEVPTRGSGGGVALREESAARGLLAIVEVGVGRVELTPDVAADLLIGPYGGLEPLALRRLRVALRQEELAGGGTRPSGELLVEALAAPGRLTTIDTRPTRRADRLARTLAEIREKGGAASIEDLLWIAWERSGVAEPWRELALAGGIPGAEADRRLDGVVALFTTAKRFAERRPDEPAVQFLTELLDSDVPEDVLTPRRDDDAVLVTTPSGAVGLEFRTVVVAGLQDGAWPNLRPRGSLLGAAQLVRAAQGAGSAAGTEEIDERKLVLDDELRMFALAVSRARERVVLAAVSNDDEARSAFFGLLPPDAPLLDAGALAPLSLRGMTGRLRRTVAGRGADPTARAEAAGALAHLAEVGIPGAAPAQWQGLLPISTEAPLFEGVQIPVSPSRLERFEESPLDWFLETVAGSSSTVAMSVGTIVHWAMETATDPTAEAIWAAVESRWSELLFDAPWLAEHQRRATRVLAAGVAEYLRDFAASGAELIGAEDRIEFDVGPAQVRGSIDRVERAADGSVVIVDLKTGSPITSAARIQAHPQLGVYQLAYREGLLDEALAPHGEHAPGGAKLLYVKKGEKGRLYREGVQAALDDAGLEGFRERIRQAAIGMAAASYAGVIELKSYGLGNVARLKLHRVGAVSGD